MPRLLRQYERALLESAVRNDESSGGYWEWRERYIGAEGVLSVYESTSKAPGKCFIRMEYYGGYKLAPADDSPGELEGFWLAQALDGLDYGPSELAGLVEEVTKEQVVAVAKSVVCDLIYFLCGTDPEEAEEEEADDEN